MKLLGIDAGTTSLKAALFDQRGEMLKSTTVDYTLDYEGDMVEWDAEAYFSVLQRALSDIGEEADALAIDTQCETLILTDENGSPVRRAIVWLDNRATAEALEIEGRFGREKVYEVTGQPETTATWPASKLLWVKRNEPEVWRKTKKIFLLEDYLIFRLTGSFVTEKTLQSSSLYFDIRKGEWWDEMLDFLGISRDMLPRLADSGQVVGKYKKTKVVTSAMDQVAGAIGAGNVSRETASEMTGTTMAVFVPTDKIPAFDRESIIPCHYNFDGNYCLLSWSPTAGMALKWFRDNFCENFDFKELDKIAWEVPAGCEGLVFLPYLCGSTMPKCNPKARGSFTGITPGHTRGHFVRSILEAVACMLHDSLLYMDVSCNEIISMGGGAKSPLWCKIKADITGKKIVTLKNSETACLGSAILAGTGIGVYENVAEACKKIVRRDKEYTPSGESMEMLYRRYLEYDKLLNRRNDE